jgi:hypothetical protein
MCNPIDAGVRIARMGTVRSGSTRWIVARAAVAAYAVAAAALVGLVTIALFFWIGQPWGTINDVALLVMTLALAPLTLAFYELGGWTPTPLARIAQASGWIAVATWSALQVLMIAGEVTFDYSRGATGVFAIQTAALVVIGLWVAGANLLAGPWLDRVRSLGLVSGISFVVLGAGLLFGGVDHPLTYLGGVGYEIVVPIWAFLMARLLRRISTGSS